ncbi:MAG: branched-chain amino acid ABC transporter permease [Deferribacteraceae bacterium]|jgi:branched-chain amino acid transport system permease protein|nr:branched-chain amino acid ABC transporter permease [Deferribacteraceae bacterium]
MDLIFNSYVLQIITMCSINIIIVLGLNLITGVTGQLSLGHAAFASIGAYASTLLMLNLGLPFFLALPLGALVAGVSGFFLGVPILRLRGDYLAIATLGFCEIVRVVFLNLKITRGALGISGIPHHTTPLIAAVLAILSIAFMFNMENSRFGLALKSIREDEIASEMMGINIAKYKIMAFAIGSAFAGLGGALYACQITFISPVDFGFMKSVEQLCMLVLGGMGSIVGVVAGSIILTSIPELLRFASEYRMVMYGIVLIMIMAFRPQGLFGNIKVNL